MKVKFGILSLALSVGAVTLFADDNTKGIDFYRAGMLDEAKAVLLANLQNDKVDKAETCYFLGEVYSDLNMKDSAAYYYKEGLVADPDYVFNSIGELKLGLKENPNQDSAFDGFFTGKNKKNPLIYIAVARAYLPVSIDKAKEYIVKEGSNVEYGARPLKRVIRQMVENPLSKDILSGKFQEGDTVFVDVNDDEIVFNKK